MPSVCSICTTSEENRPVNGVVPDMPTGWSITTIAERGRHVRNFLLCRSCTARVRSVVNQTLGAGAL
jgi:hypothetical protein